MKAQQRAGKLTVIERGRNDLVRRQLHQPGPDADRVIGGSRQVKLQSGGYAVTQPSASVRAEVRRPAPAAVWRKSRRLKPRGVWNMRIAGMAIVVRVLL